MPVFSAAQLREVREIILRYHAGMAYGVFGSAAVDPELERSLRALGLIPKDAPALITDAYVYGQLMERAGSLIGANATPETILEHLRLHPQPALNAAERAAVETAAKHAGQYVVGLGSRVASTVTAKIAAIEDAFTPEKIQEIIRDKTAANRERREAAKTLASDLGHEVGNWTRDWYRIAFTETNDSIQEGMASSLERDHGDPFVCKIVAPTCCDHCRRFYVDSDGNPKIYLLSELRANGSNVGKKPRDWKPVVGSTHPHCACMLQVVPAGMKFRDGSLVPADEMKKSEHAHKPHDRYSYQGIPIVVENAEGSARHWGDPNSGDRGTTWMQADYGRIPGAIGEDDETLDVYVGPDDAAGTVYIVHQRKKLGPDKFAGHDEDKVILGVSSESEARQLYLAHYDDPRFLGSITTMSIAKFKRVLAANKGKKLRLKKSYAAGEVAELLAKADLTSPFSVGRPAFVTPEAGGIPRERAENLMAPAELIGFTAEGARRVRKKLARRSKDARAADKKIGEAFREPRLVLTQMKAPSAAKSAESYAPDGLAEMQRQSREVSLKIGRSKTQAAKEAAERRADNPRVSDLSGALRKSPRLILRRPRPRSPSRAQRVGSILQPRASTRREGLDEPIKKAQGGGPFIGPRGGKWADAAHTIPWKEGVSADAVISAEKHADASGKQAGHKEAHEPLAPDHEHKVGDTHEIHAKGLYPFTAKIVADDGDTVTVGQSAESAHGTKMPKASFSHFVNDMRGVVHGEPTSTSNEHINAVISGKAEHLGKGDDGIAFRHGDKVVKVSTTVPYQPFNPGHLTPEAAADRLGQQVATGNAMHDVGVPGIMRSEFVRHGDKGFQIKPYVEIPEKLTREQLDSVAASVKAAHEKGWVFGDEIQVGVLDGKLVHFDTGKAHRYQTNKEIGRLSHFGDQKDDDIAALKRLYTQHGEKYLTDEEKADPSTEWESLMDAVPSKMDEAQLKEHTSKLLRHSFKIKAFIRDNPDKLIYDADMIDADMRAAMDKVKAAKEKIQTRGKP